MTPPTGRSRNPASRSASRVRSPVVSTPGQPAASTTMRQAPIVRQAHHRLAHRGLGARARARVRPSRRAPGAAASGPASRPGCSAAKSSRRNPFTSSSATASASPRARATVVLVVGARSWGQASSATAPSSATVGHPGERGIHGAGDGDDRHAHPLQRARQPEQLLRLSALAEQMATSLRPTMPRSPCSESTGWR